MPYVMAFNRPACPAAMAEVARAMGVAADQSEDRLSRAAITAVAELFGVIGIPTTLAALGVTADKIGWVAEQSLASQRLIKNNPRPLDATALAMIITAAFHGDLAPNAS